MKTKNQKQTNKQKAMSQRHGLSGRVPALQAQSPEFHKTKRNKKQAMSL
jgi:hypothetical protein